MGALTQLYAGTMPEGANLGGQVRRAVQCAFARIRAAWLTRARTHQYLIPWARIGKARKETADRETGRKLWEWLENEVKDI